MQFVFSTRRNLKKSKNNKVHGTRCAWIVRNWTNLLTCVRLNCSKCGGLYGRCLAPSDVIGTYCCRLYADGTADGWETNRSIDRGQGGLIQIVPAPGCLPFKCLPAEMCSTVPSTLLAKHNVEKIKTIRPLNTSLNQLQGNRQPRNSKGRRRSRRRRRRRRGRGDEGG